MTSFLKCEPRSDTQVRTTPNDENHRSRTSTVHAVSAAVHGSIQTKDEASSLMMRRMETVSLMPIDRSRSG